RQRAFDGSALPVGRARRRPPLHRQSEHGDQTEEREAPANLGDRREDALSEKDEDERDDVRDDNPRRRSAAHRHLILDGASAQTPPLLRGLAERARAREDARGAPASESVFIATSSWMGLRPKPHPCSAD